MRSFRDFALAQDGATAIEYALISAFIALILLAALTNLGGRLSDEFSEISSALK